MVNEELEKKFEKPLLKDHRNSTISGYALDTLAMPLLYC